MICPFRIEERSLGGQYKEQVFKSCLKNYCPAYRYKEVYEGTFKDVCLRLVDSEDTFYENDAGRS